MRRFLRRLRTTVLLLAGVCVLNFAIVLAAPGSPLDYLTGPQTTEHFLQARAERLGLNQSPARRWLVWMKGLAHGDLGTSYQGGSVNGYIGKALRHSVLLMGCALLLGTVLAFPVGISAARRPGGLWDKTVGALALAGLGWPSFLLSLGVIWLFALKLGWLPAGGMGTPGMSDGIDRLRHMVLPVCVLAFGVFARLVRYLRSLTAEVSASSYMEAARAKGLSPRRALWRHALPNIALPMLNLLGLELPGLVGGAAVTERIFQWPGMGTLLLNAVGRRDYPVILGVNLTVAVTVVLVNWAVDTLGDLADPLSGSET